MKSNASIYDRAPILLIERFPWNERVPVLGAIRRILGAARPRWAFGGAYLFWAQTVPESEDASGTLLYVGEAEDLAVRQSHHFTGNAVTGNKFADLTAYFIGHPTEVCGVALMVVRPASLDWLYAPPDDAPVLEDDARRRPGQELEALLLRASLNIFGSMPLFNCRNDASRFRHSDDGVPFDSLIRFLLNHRDAFADFVNFGIRADESEAVAHLAAVVDECKQLR